MINRAELVSFIEEEALGADVLATARAMDDMANGVQVHGVESVGKVAVGVSLNAAFLAQAVSWGAQCVIFHHGLDVRVYKSQLPTATQTRLRHIFTHDLTVIGYHAALDIHPTIGNNARIIAELGASRGEPLFEGWGYTATFDTPQEVSRVAAACKALFDHDVLAIPGGADVVQTIGVVSGAGKPRAQHLSEMHAKGVELFITGEPSESVPHMMAESGIGYLACGHYATETFGIKALADAISAKFKGKLDVRFIDVPNSI